MPRLNVTDNMQVFDIPGAGSFQFSAVKIDDLGATEYTLVTMMTDISASVYPFAKELLNCVRQIVDACRKNPRADNLLLRLLSFNSEVEEIHGFKPLIDIKASDYRPFKTKGMTALYDATYSGIAATLEMAERLVRQDFEVNGCVYIITDGMDNVSKVTPAMIADKIKAALNHEDIESLATVLVGLIDPKAANAADIRQALTEFQVEAGLDEFIDAGNATPENLARLAKFVSRSISARSVALGGGQPPPLTF